MPNRTLIFIPTYNERENVEPMVAQLLALGLDADLLFLDDDSPDGTGQVLDALAARHARLLVIHRAGKRGIGSAHLDGIAWAYDHGYDLLATLDCDFTHSPADLARLLEAVGDHDIAVGSRYLQEGSLPGWNPVGKQT
jgi:dolichol-phosphate mannosyltransferase